MFRIPVRGSASFWTGWLRVQALPQPAGLPDQVRGLSVVLVETRAQRALWNTFLAHEHPRGAKRFLGPQLQYLIHSDHGYLGAVGFSGHRIRLRPQFSPISAPAPLFHPVLWNPISSTG